MNKMGYYIDYVSSGNSKGFMGQSPPRITLSKAIQTTINPLSPHNCMISYTYNIIVYMSYAYLCIVITELKGLNV